MAKIYKSEMYIVDYNDTYRDLEEIINDIENSCPDLIIKPFDVEQAELQWHDEVDLNYEDCPLENCRKYFKKESE